MVRVCAAISPCLLSKGARIEIENQTDVNIGAFYYYIDYVEMKELPKDMGRFHAWFNREITEALPEGETEWGFPWGKQTENKDGADNYVFADIKGKGHFVGLNYYVQCPTPMWYGEGDDMWFIDGEKQSSLIGTGTEDLFNTAWCPKEPYQHIYFGYPRVIMMSDSWGVRHVYRVLYSRSRLLRERAESHHRAWTQQCLTLDLATVAYWYQDKATAVPAIPDKAGRKLKPMVNNVMIHKWRHEWRKNKGNKADLWGDE